MRSYGSRNKQATAAVFVIGLVWLMSLMSACSNREGRPVRIVVPTGFRGVFHIQLDEENGEEPSLEQGMVVYQIPSNAVLRTAFIEPLSRSHREEVTYQDGNTIPSHIADTNGVFYQGWSSPRWNYFCFIGTQEEFLKRNRAGTPIRVVLPTGFRGSARIRQDRQNGEEAVLDAGAYVYRIPSNGTLATSYLAPFTGLYSLRVFYEDGAEIPTLASGTNEVFYHLSWDRQPRTKHLIVGSSAEIADAWNRQD